MNTGLLTIAQPHFYQSEEQAYTSAGTYTFQLPLPMIPTLVRAVLVCKVTDQGYAVGDEIEATNLMQGSTSLAGVTVATSAGRIEVFASPVLSVRQKSSPAGAAVQLTMTNFSLKIYAFWPALA